MKRIKSFVQLAFILLLQVAILWSCKDHNETPPLPVHKDFYLQPETRSFTFSEPDTLTWLTQDPSKLKPLPTTKFDWNKLPTKEFDIGIPMKFVGTENKTE